MTGVPPGGISRGTIESKLAGVRCNAVLYATRPIHIQCIGQTVFGVPLIRRVRGSIQHLGLGRNNGPTISSGQHLSRRARMQFYR